MNKIFIGIFFLLTNSLFASSEECKSMVVAAAKKPEKLTPDERLLVLQTMEYGRQKKVTAEVALRVAIETGDMRMTHGFIFGALRSDDIEKQIPDHSYSLKLDLSDLVFKGAWPLSESYRWNPLQFSVLYERYDSAYEFLKAGIKAGPLWNWIESSTLDRLLTPVGAASVRPLSSVADKWQILQNLIENGYEPVAGDLLSAIHDAYWGRQRVDYIIKDLLEKFPATFKPTLNQALSVSAGLGLVNAIDELIKQGADINNTVEKYGRTPLELATYIELLGRESEKAMIIDKLFGYGAKLPRLSGAIASQDLPLLQKLVMMGAPITQADIEHAWKHNPLVGRHSTGEEPESKLKMEIWRYLERNFSSRESKQ